MTVFVDSSVWIDLLADRVTLQTQAMHRIIAEAQRLQVGDLVLAEVLQGARTERLFRSALSSMSAFDQVNIGGRSLAIEAAQHYRTLRQRGITIRKTIDCLIAAHCIRHDIPLLYADRDFDPFVEHLGLISALIPAPE